jgi:hypothetical protein
MMVKRTVFLMRGLPSCGKSYTARRLAGTQGVVCETDEFFYTQVGRDPSRFDFDRQLRDTARQWNFERFRRSLRQRRPTIVVDRGNGLNAETVKYARAAVESGYQLQLAEPESEWWSEIRVLLKYKEATWDILTDWARKLAEKNRATHGTPEHTIRHWMKKWRHDLTVEQILRHRPPRSRLVAD